VPLSARVVQNGWLMVETVATGSRGGADTFTPHLRHSERSNPTGSTLADQARDALRRHALEPLVPRCVDREYGGFLVDFDDRWQPVGPHEKSLEHATRTTIALALLDRVMPGEGCDRLVRHGCAFLQEVMWDREHGGFFARVDRGGRPLWDGLKHPHAVNYAARAFQLAERYLPAGDGEAWANRALAWLDDVAWDGRHGGYWGTFRRDNVRYAAGTRLPTPSGRDVFGLSPGLKEINTQGDAIEMLTAFVESGAGHRCADRLGVMVSLVADRLIDAHGVMPYAYRPDWRPVPDLLRVGYQFMMARHLALAPGEPRRAAALVARSAQLVDFCLAAARHPRGGFCLAVAADGRTWPATGPSSDLRQWWVQVEAAYTLSLLSQHESIEPEARARYRTAFEEQWAFVRRVFFDERYRGLRELPFDEPRTHGHAWLRRLVGRQPRGPPLKSHPWKDMSHEVGALIALTAERGNPKAR
jgi:cellobiose epimerase